ncbi:TonB-dependent receptor [Caenibius sp. WL]|uniref:TonB-dependent receptor domain-containing protein n=1 Tax=Caenibius sp. WL TaxID=2872646 RepID=UPI001C992DBD|nr:TonB-dependent receptor [Caenibius sp. WL]
MPANKAIQTFAQQAGVDVIAPGETLRGVTTNPVRGTADVHDALDQMLRGTPLEARKSGERTYLIKAAPQRPQKIAYTAPPAPVAAVAATPAVVEEAPVRSGAGLSEIIVTAQKREESLQDTPISIAVLNSGDMEKRGVFTLADLGSGSVPSIRISPASGRPSVLVVAMRGISPGDVTQISRDSTVGIYMDGVYVGRAQGLGTEMLDLERIEVLRGPQGTLFGRNAVAGAVSMVSKRPTGKLGLDLTAGIRNFDGQNVKAHLNLPEFAGFKIKLDGVWNKRDGWVKNSLPGASDWSATNRRGARVSVLWEPAANLEFLYSFDTSRDASTPAYPHIRQLLPGAVLPPLFSVEDRRVSKGRAGVPMRPGVGKVSGHSLYANWDISDNLTLRSISAYRKLSQSQYDNQSSLVTAYASNDVFARLSYADVHQDQFSQEVQFLGSFDNLKFVLGGFYYKEDADDLAFSAFTARFNSTGTSYTLLPVVIGGPTYPERASAIHTRSKAIFGQATYTPPVLDERLHLTGGLRWTHDRKWGALNKLRGATVHLPFEFQSKRLDPAFTVAFDWTDAINTYVRWGKAYRAGGANSRSMTFREFEDEEVASWEIGLKTELFDRRVRFNLAAFRTRYSNRQVDFLNPISTSNIETLNAPGAPITKGLEVDLTARVAPGLTLSGSYVFTDWRTVDNINPFTGRVERGVVNGMPKHAASVALDHEFEPFDGVTLSTHLDAIYSSSFYTSGSTAPKTPAYAALNGRVTLGDIDIASGSKLALSLWGKNLTNAQWPTFQTTFAAAGFVAAYMNEPRTYGLEARISF